MAAVCSKMQAHVELARYQVLLSNDQQPVLQLRLMNDTKPKCVLIPESKRFAKTVIRTIRFDEPDLIIELQGPAFSYVRIVFRDVIGYRVIDEREITEFWNDYSESNGWLWEVLEGGWLTLERSRLRFNPLQFNLREFFVVDNYCVNVLCTELPEIHNIGAEPNHEAKT